jgi:hypothetical protein
VPGSNNAQATTVRAETLDNFDFTFNPKMNRSLVFNLATCAFIANRDDALFLGPPEPQSRFLCPKRRNASAVVWANSGSFDSAVLFRNGVWPSK